jgi:ParB family chromosome partitioning protein
VAKKSGLGKGLASLMGEANAEVSAMTPDTEVELSKIHPNKDQPRKNFDKNKLNELADSIKKNGILQPLLIRKKGESYEIVAGERRYQAAKIAGLTQVPVVIREISDSEVFQLALIENLQRADLNPIEEAQGYKKLIDKDGITQEELGKILSKSRPSIANALRLLDLPAEIQTMLSDGLLSAGHARAILAVPNETGRLKLADKVIHENLTVRQTEQLAPLFSGKTDQNTRREPTPQSFIRAARQLRLALDTKVRVKRVRNKNKIEIEFNTEEDLARLVSQLSLLSDKENGVRSES